MGGLCQTFGSDVRVSSVQPNTLTCTCRIPLRTLCARVCGLTVCQAGVAPGHNLSSIYIGFDIHSAGIDAMYM